MPNAVVTDLLDAVVAELNTIKPTMNQTYTATRAYLPDVQRAKMKDAGTLLFVGCGQVETEGFSREEDSFEYEVHIATLASVKITETTALDQLVYLGQQFSDYFRSHDRLTVYPDSAITKVETAVIYDTALLQADGVFASLLALTVQVIR